MKIKYWLVDEAVQRVCAKRPGENEWAHPEVCLCALWIISERQTSFSLEK